MIKKAWIILSACSLMIITFPAVAPAAPVGNPAGPVLLEGNYPTKFSLEVETVLDRKLKAASYRSKFVSTFYTGKFSLYLGQKLDVYGLVGINEGRVKNFLGSSGTTTGYDVLTKTCGYWGGGVSYVVHSWEWSGGILRLGVDAKYRQFDPDLDDVKQQRQSVTASKDGLSFKEWQAAAGLSYQYKRFIPYVGVKYSDMGAHIKFTHAGVDYSDKTLDSDNIFGLYYGLDVLVTDSISFNIEGRCIDETAANIGMNARF